MLSTVTAFLKPYTMWIVGGTVALIVGAFTWMSVDLALTKSALETTKVKLEASEQIIEAQERAIEAVNRIDALEEELDEVRRQGRARVAQAEGANDEIPPAVADAWLANSDSVLAYRGNPRAIEELRLPE